MIEVEWTQTALEDMAALDKGIARRIKQSVERFAETGAGNYRVRFHHDSQTLRIRRVRNRREAYR